MSKEQDPIMNTEGNWQSPAATGRRQERGFTRDEDRVMDRALRDPDVAAAVRSISGLDFCDPRTLSRAQRTLGNAVDEAVRDAANDLGVRISPARADQLEEQVRMQAFEPGPIVCPVAPSGGRGR